MLSKLNSAFLILVTSLSIFTSTAFSEIIFGGIGVSIQTPNKDAMNFLGPEVTQKITCANNIHKNFETALSKSKFWRTVLKNHPELSIIIGPYFEYVTEDIYDVDYSSKEFLGLTSNFLRIWVVDRNMRDELKTNFDAGASIGCIASSDNKCDVKAYLLSLS